MSMRVDTVRISPLLPTANHANAAAWWIGLSIDSFVAYFRHWFTTLRNFLDILVVYFVIFFRMDMYNEYYEHSSRVSCLGLPSVVPPVLFLRRRRT